MNKEKIGYFVLSLQIARWDLAYTTEESAGSSSYYVNYSSNSLTTSKSSFWVFIKIFTIFIYSSDVLH